MIHEQILEKKLKAAQLECQKEGQNLMKINVPLKSTLSNLVHSLSYLISALSDAKDPVSTFLLNLAESNDKA